MWSKYHIVSQCATATVTWLDNMGTAVGIMDTAYYGTDVVDIGVIIVSTAGCSADGMTPGACRKAEGSPWGNYGKD